MRKKSLEDFSYEKQPGMTLCRENVKNAIDSPKLSIITPYYNAGKNFEQTYNCVINQTFTAYEWIIVDDGSSQKDSVDILERLAEKDARVVVFHQPNGGQSKAKNYGIKHSKSEIIVFLDADDLIEPFYLEIVYRALQKHPKASWSYTDLVGFGTQEYIWCKPFSAGRMTFNNTLVNAAAFRKEVLEQIGGFPEIAKHYDEDWALYLKLLSNNCHPVHIPVIGFWYRRSDTGMQQTVRKDEALRRESDAYMAKLAKSVDIHLKCEEYEGILDEKMLGDLGAYRTEYSIKEKILAKIMDNKWGLWLIKKVYAG